VIIGLRGGGGGDDGDVTLRQMNTQLDSIEACLSRMEARLATKGELHGWAGVLSGLLAIAVAILLKYG
jgi:hypothetical protein